MYSERSARDATHIAQIVGRMVRQPLAHRVETDDTLNTVACFLPGFNVDALERVRAELEGTGDSGTDSRVASTVSVKPATFARNPTLPVEVFDFVETLPSVTVPDSLASPLRRARKLAQLLADDASGAALVADAGAQLTAWLNAELDGLAAKHKTAVADGVEDFETLDVAQVSLGAHGQDGSTRRRQIVTHLADLDRDTRRIVRSAKEGAGLDYLKYRIDEAGHARDIATVRAEVAALLRVDGVLAELDSAASRWVMAQLDAHSTAIKNTTGQRRAAFQHVRETTSAPETVRIALRDNVNTATRSRDGEPLPLFAKHLFADADGTFPAQLNSWETEVIRTEIERPSTVAWYRNPPRPSPVALRLAYQRDDGRWTSLQPDFVVISRRDDGTLAASIVDPHGDHLADARNKLNALADYAEQHADHYVRVESIGKIGDDLRALDLLNATTRQAVRDLDGAEVSVLYRSDVSETLS